MFTIFKLDTVSSNTAEIYDYSNQQKTLDCGDYEPANEYDESDITLDSYHKVNDLEPVIDYDQTSLCSVNSANKVQMSTFNHTNTPPSPSGTKTNTNLILMMLKQQQQQQQQQTANNSSSPLTPRQIKQRNTAKRNSIPRSSSSNPQVAPLTAQQQRDLSFLQTQKFEADFIQTTKDLFARYPNAKISISVTVSSIQQNGSSASSTSGGGQQLVQTQSTRQIEIDRLMFEKICTFQQIQPLGNLIYYF